MQLYNTLTRKLEQFEPKDPAVVTLYSCGPTVYDYPHIGNYSAFLRWDTLARVLRESGYSVDWVMNITDVGHLTSDADEGEDKLEKGAKRESKTAWEIAEFYTKDFMQSLHDLNFVLPDHIVKATDHIPEQINLVKRLEQKGFTYVIDDGVYFDTSKLSDYGKLARLKVEGLKEGARVATNMQKHNPTDFALWKFSPKDEQRDMEWESPWGKGFPGWHLECSAMSMKYLGETIDIHAGGIDHIPVHHTNEIAQSEAATGKQFARYWVHNGHISVDDSKISKSLGNGIVLADLKKQGFEPLDIRMLFLQSQYRTGGNFTLGALQAARNRRLSLQAFADLRFQLRDGGEVDEQSIKATKKVMLTELQRDLNSPEALAALSDLVASAETNLIMPSAKSAMTDFIASLDRVLGLKLGESADISDEHKKLITERENARGDKDFARADALRDQLAKDNIAVRDTPLGTIWSRTT